MTELDVKSDHDILVRLDTKVDDVIRRMGEIASGLNSRVSNHETRISMIEAIVQRVRPDETYKEFQTLQLDVRDFKTRYSTISWVSGIVWAAVVLAIPYLISFIASLFVK